MSKIEQWIDDLRRKFPWLDHVLRANDAFNERNGNHYAAAITYFSVLSIIPILMVAFGVLGIILAGNDRVVGQIRQGIDESVPEGLGPIVGKIVDVAIENGAGLGIVGLLIALYAGIGWMGNLRDALTAQWGQEGKEVPFVSKTIGDLVSLVGLGLALIVSFALTAIGSTLGGFLLDLVGLGDQTWASVLLRIVSILLSVAANMLVFLWVIARLPRERVAMRSAVKGALLAAVGFVILQQVMAVYLEGIGSNPAFAVFGPMLGLLVFANFVSRMLLFVTAWTATSEENLELQAAKPADAVIVRPQVTVRSGPGAGDVAGLLGIGGLLGYGASRLRRK